MKTPPKLPLRSLLFLIAVAAIACFIASVRYQSVEAFATNGRIAFTSDNVIYTINADGSGLLQLTLAADQVTTHRDHRFAAFGPERCHDVGRTCPPIETANNRLLDLERIH